MFQWEVKKDELERLRRRMRTEHVDMSHIIDSPAGVYLNCFALLRFKLFSSLNHFNLNIKYDAKISRFAFFSVLFFALLRAVKNLLTRPVVLRLFCSHLLIIFTHCWCVCLLIPEWLKTRFLMLFKISCLNFVMNFELSSASSCADCRMESFLFFWSLMDFCSFHSWDEKTIDCLAMSNCDLISFSSSNAHLADEIRSNE